MQRHSHCRSIVHAAPTGSSLCASFRRIFCAGASRSSRAPSTTWPHGSRPPGRRSTLRPPRGYRNLLSLLRAGVADAILAHAAPAIQAELVQLLARPGHALHPDGPCRAGVFALEVHAAIRGRINRSALVAAAAVELLMQSAYVFDDVADRPPDGRQGEDLALAIALLTASTAAA